MQADNVSRRAVFNRYLTEAEERQLFRHVAQFASVLAQRDHAWMRLLRQTGLRIGSLAGLTVADAQEALATGVIIVRPEIAKRGLGYTVDVNKSARAALRDLLRLRREMGHPPVGDEPLVVSIRGRALSVRSFQARMHDWVQQAGLPVAASPHWFRHTLAKRLIARSEAADPLGIVQAALGQRTRTSSAVYALPDREDVRRAMEAAR